jgi:hypothetical protein
MNKMRPRRDNHILWTFVNCVEILLSDVALRLRNIALLGIGQYTNIGTERQLSRDILNSLIKFVRKKVVGSTNNIFYL